MQLTDLEVLIGALAEAEHAGITTAELLSLSLKSTSIEHLDGLVSKYSDQVRGPDVYVIYEGTGNHVQAMADIIAG